MTRCVGRSDKAASSSNWPEQSRRGARVWKPRNKAKVSQTVASGCDEGGYKTLISDHLVVVGLEAAGEWLARSAILGQRGCHDGGPHSRRKSSKPACGTSGAERFPRGSTRGCPSRRLAE